MDILDDKIKELKKYLINDIIDIVKIPSVKSKTTKGSPFEKEIGKALEKALEISKKLGFKTKNIDGYVGYAEYGEGDEYIAVIGHLDNKIPTISVLYALKFIKDSNIKLNKKFRIIFRTNEEYGFEDMEYYFKKEKAPIIWCTPNCKYTVLCKEKGIASLSIQQDINIEDIKIYQNSITDKILNNCCIEIPKEYIYEDIICYLEDKANSDEGIVSTYKNINIKINEKYVIINSFINNDIAKLKHYGNNVIINLVNYLVEENFIEHEELNNYFIFINKHFCDENYIMNKKNVEEKLNLKVYDLRFKDRNISLDFNVSYPINYKISDAVEDINNALPNNIQLLLNKNYKSLNIDKNFESIKSCESVIQNIVSLESFSSSQNEIAHNRDEYITIDDIISNTKIFAHAIYELDKEV
ncbi:dipeptidase PepV [Paraclostridium ghonii]|uniref:Succinyl-diaminopimelate desuccinylase n=1 Tax=Paraclostridium ghonii TaxID=29358 RepID=A0ABU0N1M2_9FIRM|nr:M20/M25/M40 family metallo-hydrolase [Paeniclostridium ghonii]MDQ0557069.1 succinyl-diaminopimelate desuccinylase [Paeniclostridium ghonii]